LDIYLYGCGGHAKVILDSLHKQRRKVTAFIDDAPPLEMTHIHKIPIFQSTTLNQINPQKSTWIVAIGNNLVRQQIALKLSELGHSFTTAIHPSAQIALGVTIGAGTVVMANAVINTDTQIGQHGIINTGATVDHDCLIGDYVHIAPGCSLCGQVTVGQGSLLGVGTKVCPGVEIGEYTLCGAGSVVIESLPSHSLAYGCPAKIRTQLSQNNNG
jgi:sugar O-acyltransferase (sialic acid O-acetyltransferase NeuD family)